MSSAKLEGGGLVESLSAEIARLEGERGRIEETLMLLRELRGEATALDARAAAALGGARPPAPPTARPRKPRAARRPPSPRQAAPTQRRGSDPALGAERREELVELLTRLGPQSQVEIERVTGWRKQPISTHLRKLQEAGKAHRTGGKRGGGRGSPVWAAGPNPNPGGRDSTPEPEPDDEGERHPEPDERPPAPLDERTRANTARGERKAGQFRAEVDAYLREHGPSTLKAIYAALGLAERGTSMHSFVGAMIQNPWAESWGEDAEAGKVTWRHVPKPEEREGVKIRRADRSGTVASRVLTALEDHGRLTGSELAAHVVLHPRLVNEAVEELEADGAIAKLPTGKYELALEAAA